MPEIKKVIVVFKTHLDMGFTDFAENVRQKYIDEFIPAAIDTGRTLREKGGEARFCWATGSWLINDFLDNAPPEQAEALCEAISAGDISWHALPFTTHSELMTPELFRYGLSISQKLDARLGKKTIAAKMTDVPGHTKAIIPLLCEAGIELLHLGVNPASAVPDVPEIFRWRFDDKNEITVIYSGEYGDATVLADSGTALFIAHTGDNLGGQSAKAVEDTFAALHLRFPGAEIIAGTLDDAAKELRKVKASLPVVTDEIGDSWIHGSATDPAKMSMFRSMERFCLTLPEGEDKQTLLSGLLMIPEHTWGLDLKTHLSDWKNYSPQDLSAHRNDPNFRKMEESWQEQRNYILDTVKNLSAKNRHAAEALLSESSRAKTDVSAMRPVAENEEVKLGDSVFSFNSKGEIIHLEINGIKIADSGHRLCRLFYEHFCFDDYIKFHRAYHRADGPWVWCDFVKLGMDYMTPVHRFFYPSASVFVGDDRIVVKYTFESEAFTSFGAPKEAELLISEKDGDICFDLAWFGKTANRGAEAVWFGFEPDDRIEGIGKIGQTIDPRKVASRGSRALHATDSGVKWNKFTAAPLDSALVCVGFPAVTDFANRIPSETDGVFFGLYNNIWNTNFPMWYDEDARFRFILSLNNTD